MKRAPARRFGTAPAIGLSFLDVLCCGLGSPVFLLLVIQRGPSPVPDEGLLVADDLARVESEIDETDQRIAGTRSSLAAVAETIRAALAAMQAIAGLSGLQKQQAQDTLAVLRSERRRLDAETAALDALRTQAPPPPETPREHLTGLRVAEDRVAVFLDSSASMLDHSLINILRLRVSSDGLKLGAEKWTTARNAVGWVYERVPEGGRYLVFHYADAMRELQGATIPAGRIGWRAKNENLAPPRGQYRVETALATLLPDGPTNLAQVFETAARLAPKPAQIVLITDGLPTLPGDKPLQRLRHCKRPPRNATPLISAACRMSIFDDAVAAVPRSLANTRIDIILLPLEGDSAATGQYWNLAWMTGGRMLAPAKGWPEA